MMNYAAAQRNAAPILEAMAKHIPITMSGTALEVGSGTGQHVALLARQYPALKWQPTDLEQRLLTSVDHHTSGLTNVLPARRLDAAADWAPQLPQLAAGSLQLVLCVNVVHIAPWPVALGLLAGAGRFLRPGGALVMYGPFAKDGVLAPQSNVNFDAMLRAENKEWGVRDIRDLAAVAGPHGLRLDTEVNMPANNKLLIWKRI